MGKMYETLKALKLLGGAGGGGTPGDLASEDITAMTGYAKATTGSAIATTDTLNQAIGKVEKRVDINETNISSLQSNFSELATKNVQYLDQSTLENKSLWTGNATKQHNESWGFFNAYDAFEIPAGDYTFIDSIYVEYCYYKGAAGTRISLKNYIGTSVTNYTGDVTFSENVTLYISIYRTDSSKRKCRLVNKTSSELIDIPYTKGAFAISLSNLVKIPSSQIYGDYTVFEQAYIKDKELVANAITPTAQNAIAHYTAADMDDTVISVKAKIKFYGNAFSTLISENNGVSKVKDVTAKSIHINISRTKYYIGYFNGFNLTNVLTGNMSGVTEGDEKTVGFELDTSTDTLTVYLPDGTTQTSTDAAWATVTGKYAIWEHYIDVTSQQFVCNHFTRLWAETSNGRILCDDFKRYDGAIGNSPQGHTYAQFTSLNPNGWFL